MSPHAKEDINNVPNFDALWNEAWQAADFCLYLVRPATCRVGDARARLGMTANIIESKLLRGSLGSCWDHVFCGHVGIILG